MLFSKLLLTCLLSSNGILGTAIKANGHYKRLPAAPTKIIRPRVLIISMFGPEAEAWYNIPDFNVLANNYTLPGLSPLYPDVHCTTSGQICQFTLGESEINAASSVQALVQSPMFDLQKTYFFIAGIAGVNPIHATMGGVSFAKYAVQVALQYEFDAREIPSNFSTGYIPQGAMAPALDQPNFANYPQSIYGTEAFEVNDNLRQLAIGFAKTAKLSDNAASKKYRANYGKNKLYAAATKPPSVVACDVATSDVYFSGPLLGEAFANYSTMITNGSAVYCATAQEDNATLEVLIRAALFNLVDFSRIIIMRTFSDFDRPYPGQSGIDNLFYGGVGFFPSLENIYNAGIKVIDGIISGWGEKFQAGIKPSNYIGDMFNSLNGPIAPDFGLPSSFINAGVRKKRWIDRRRYVLED